MSKRDLASLLLVLVGSGTDAVIILGFNVLTAAQTGNTILLSVALARGDFVTGISAALSILGFVVGAAVGGLLCRQSGARYPLFAEFVLMLAAMGSWWMAGATPGPVMLNAVVTVFAGAMGIQSAVIICLHGHPGTYVTGLLTSFAVALPGAGREGAAAKLGFLWVLYAAGAVLTGWLFLTFGHFALLLPIVALLAATYVLPVNITGKPSN